MEHFSRFLFLSAMLPEEACLKAIADAFSCDAWALISWWADITGRRGHSFMGEANPHPPLSPVPPVSTEEFLHCSGDDRAAFWTEAGDVRFSDEMEHWLASIGERYRVILADLAVGIGQDDFVRVLIDMLDDLETRYRGAFCFEELFYRLLTNASQKEAQVLVLLLGRISEEYRAEEAAAENPAEMEAAHTTAIRRLYAVLGNPNLRKKVLGLRW